MVNRQVIHAALFMRNLIMIISSSRSQVKISTSWLKSLIHLAMPATYRYDMLLAGFPKRKPSFYHIKYNESEPKGIDFPPGSFFRLFK